MKRLLVFVPVFVLLLVLFLTQVQNVSAQAVYSVRGVITFPSGPTSRVTLSAVSIESSRKLMHKYITVSDELGKYVFYNLDPGMYKITPQSSRVWRFMPTFANVWVRGNVADVNFKAIK
jgi:hypothetical protein